MAEAAQRPKGWKLLRAALATRKAATMLAFGFSSGLPFALLIGTLNAWLGDAKINLATIGVLSWIGLSYAFKFLWSPLVDRVKLPLLGQLGRRKSWIVLCQAGLVISFIGLGASNPAAEYRRVRDLRGDRSLRFGHAGHRGRCLADRCRRREDSGRAALGCLPVRLSNGFDRRRRLCLAACGPDAVGHRVLDHGRTGDGHDGGCDDGSRHPAAHPRESSRRAWNRPAKSTPRCGWAHWRLSACAGCGRSSRSHGSWCRC